MGKNNFKFKKNESFYIRDGWFEKALNTINEFKSTNIFAKNNGILYLGIGSNMVKGLKYWLQASGILTEKDNSLTSLGKLILKYDRYFEDTFTWFLIHYNLCSNFYYCPVFYAFFNNNFQSFHRNLMNDYLLKYFENYESDVNQDYIDADLNVFLKSYINDEIIDNPEDNYVCPLSMLNLIRRDRDVVKKIRPLYSSLSYLLVYYALLQSYKGNRYFDIDDSFVHEGSPFLIFNLDKNIYLQYLDEMKKNGLITINKTAGLNVVYFEKKLNLSQIFDYYYGGK